MLLSSLLALAASLVPSTLAVFADDAYHVDYHYALLGAPQQHAAFFHQPRPDSKASLLYALSDKLVLGAVNPRDGAAVWRQPLSSSSTAVDGFLRAGENQDTVISAVEGQVAAWDAADGKLAWSSSFKGASVKDLEVLELADASAAASGTKDVVVLFGGSSSTARRLDGQTGEVKWEFEDNSGDVPFQISTSATAVYSISLHSTMLGGLKIKVTALNPLSGQKVDQYTLSSESEVSTADDILFVGANTASPLLAWTDKSYKSLKVNIIGTKGISTFSIENNSGEEIQKVVLHAPHSINSLPHFLVHYQTASRHWAEVYHADLKAGSISKAYDLPKLAGQGAFATSTTDANVYFTRITPEEVLVVSSASHGILGRWPVKNAVFDDSVYPLHAVSEVAVRDGSASAVRSTIYLSNGNWDLLRNGELTWSRPEVLSGALDAIWVDFPTEESLAQELEIETHQSVLAAYVHRVKRHLKDLEHLPDFLQTLPNRFLPHDSASDVLDKAQRDTFGLNKPVVVATESGRFLAVSGGSVIWNHDVLELPHGQKVEEVELEVNTKGQIAAVFPQLSRHVLLNATTGHLIRSVPLKLALELDAEEATSAPEEAEFTYKIVDGEIKGFWSGSELAWRFAPTAGERIISVTPRPADDPVASIGKVLGDRRVLYKYLNPNLVLVSAVADSTGVLSVYLLDGVSGALLWQATHEGVDTTQTIAGALSENWVTYSFTLGSSFEVPSKGHQLVVAEFFESTLPNDRGPFGAASNYSAIRPFAGVVGESAKPHVLSQTYHIPEPISHMAVTQTAQGITSKWLLVTLPQSNSIVGIPRQILDPRRPVGRDPTPEEAAEGLMRYTPVIEFNPAQYLNHKREVLGIKKVITSPALLESTSLVFAYGLDVFGTRVSPSFAFDILGKGFNRLQLLATVAALFVGVLFVAPLVRRKQINARWQIV
ncbi:Quinonprotein alcohol dehydrogenase-like protein [Neofusicoccum parvum]|uniref:Quinonprotein alcohol dehydrogenase-like protein n=1 Tax=Neofusicoccum parvum TaxID=310453 RepID=A0ACB5S7U6_9PEZI|nr:Quinonprotein alcohol dehydrogenase-like protein [Neofusicoccum parvum]